MIFFFFVSHHVKRHIVIHWLIILVVSISFAAFTLQQTVLHHPCPWVSEIDSPASYTIKMGIRRYTPTVARPGENFFIKITTILLLLWTSSVVRDSTHSTHAAVRQFYRVPVASPWIIYWKRATTVCVYRNTYEREKRKNTSFRPHTLFLLNT